MNTALILVIGIPLIEIYLFIKIGSQIGAFNTVLLILTTAVVGVAYARFEGFNTLKSGIAQDSSKKIIATIKGNNKKIQCSYQNQQIRVTGKKRDDLQDVIQLVKESKIEIPLNFGNFRD